MGRALVACILIMPACGILPMTVPAPKPSPAAALILATGGYVEAYLIRRFADGRILVRLVEQGGVWVLDPKVNCLWCWTYVDKVIWLKIDQHSASAVNPKGETAEFWNGGPVDTF